MFWNWVLLIVGMALLIKSADFFVDGSSGIAKKFGIPSLIIGFQNSIFKTIKLYKTII